MTELGLIFAGGLLGSSHCVGMCGPLALAIGGSTSAWSANLARQLVYSAGRIFTYSVVGAVTGYAGMRLTGQLSGVVNAQSVLAIIAGALLIAQGLISAGLLRLPRRGSPRPACLSTGLISTYLREPGLHAAFLAGVFTGFLPCGLVYAYLALATSANTLFGGLVTMAAFGAGTVPLLVATGTSGALISAGARRQTLRVAACLVIVTGVVSIARGVAFLDLGGATTASTCPLCR